ncbi:MAG TPA: tetratricopeptide repeat protein [Thermoanaerobaculia bacterium]
MNRRRTVLIAAVAFVLGTAFGVAAAKKGAVDPNVYTGKKPKEAAAALLDLARIQAEKGSWENIGVGRVYYLSGQKAEGQAIFDSVTAKKAEGGDWIRIGRVYWEAGEWDKAKVAFDKVLQDNPKDEDWLAEIGAYYQLKGDRAKAEELFTRSFKGEPTKLWNTLRAAGSYLGLKPPE